MNNSISLIEKIGQTMICKATRYDDKSNDSIKNFLKEYPVGGVFVGAEVIKEAEEGTEGVRKTVSQYKEATKIPLLFASDFENGCGSMIRGLTPLPYMMGLGATNSEELAYDYGKVTALEAKSVGINWTFSPVADLNINPRNPLVNVRGISDNPDHAIPLLKNIVMGMQENGLCACAKHFPGDGVDWRDQHIITTKNSLSMEEWYRFHGRVFKKLIDAGVSSIMIGHITLPFYKQKLFEGKYYLPATLSEELTTELLRNEFGFKGLVVSDALGMGGFLGWYDKEKSEIECFKAGCDMLLWPSDNYIKNMLDAVENGYVTMNRLNEAVDRIMEMKEQTGTLKEQGKTFYTITAQDTKLINETQKSDYNYVCCCECGAVIHNDDAYYDDADEDDRECPYCYTCYENSRKSRVIESYNYKPSPIFYGDGLFLGVELEVDDGGESNKNAAQIIDIANKDHEHIYIKHDGSISCGFEIVTHPMSLDYHQNSFNWEAVLSKAISMGYRSHQSGSCGLHSHVNRSALGITIDEQEETIARILYFIEANWNEMLKFSRRTESQISRWASRYGLKDSPQEVLKNAKDNHCGRYVCINLENENTIEFRIFRGSLKYQTLIATLQMVDEICNAAISLSDQEFKSMTWQEFAINISDEKAELINYLKQRRLYVNEPINEEEDI